MPRIWRMSVNEKEFQNNNWRKNELTTNLEGLHEVYEQKQRGGPRREKRNLGYFHLS